MSHVVATAGHVDHGKSTLVRVLTGMEPDRWAEERRRGLTLDLGFAWTDLDGEHVAFVDVPGHERFVTTMLAGVGPVPAVLLVVAADGGWMPQSAEHLSVLDALGVRHGLLVVTRSDLADPEPSREQALTELAATSLDGVRSVAVSAATGASGSAAPVGGGRGRDAPCACRPERPGGSLAAAAPPASCGAASDVSSPVSSDVSSDETPSGTTSSSGSSGAECRPIPPVWQT